MILMLSFTVLEDEKDKKEEKVNNEVNEKPKAQDITNNSKPRRATRSATLKTPSVAVTKLAEGERRSSVSDEESLDGDPKAQKQSRIDKWKAKHEAMLKQASKKKGKKEKHEDELELDEVVVDKHKEEKNEDETKKEEEEDGILDIPNLEANGLNIDFDKGMAASTKPHTRQNAVIQQQHALSV